jgi:hypothetical protein
LLVQNNANQTAANQIVEHDRLTFGDQFRPKGWYWHSFGSRFAGPRISRLPAFVRSPVFLLRNLRFYQLPRRIPFSFDSDGMATSAIPSFLNRSEFVSAYFRMRVASRAVVDPGLQWRVHQAMWCAANCMKIDGDFVECGTGKGLMMSAVLDSLPNWNTSVKRLLLFDTFSPFGIDPSTGKNLEEHGVRGTYASNIEEVAQNFSEWQRVELIQGFLPETLPQGKIEKIAFLHVDLNHGPAEVAVVRALWSSIQRGGIMLLDDYAQVQQQNDAMNQLAQELSFEILTTASGQGIVVKF